MTILILVFALAMIAAGVLAYVGRWRSWAFARPVWSYAIGLGTLYLGIGIGVGWVIVTFGASWPLAVQRTLIAVAFAFVLVMLVSLFWFPRFLTPRWFRDLRDEQKRDRS